jgi:hypothetical protein
MPLIQNSIWTATPAEVGGDPFVPVTSFLPSDPFAIVMGIQVDQSVIDAGLPFDVVFQLVNPRQDVYNHAWYTVLAGLSLVPMPTVDTDWTGVNFQWGTNFAVWHWWPNYSDAVAQIYGPDQLSGVFFAQGTMQVEGTAWFAAASPFWYTILDLGVIQQP